MEYIVGDSYISQASSYRKQVNQNQVVVWICPQHKFTRHFHCNNVVCVCRMMPEWKELCLLEEVERNFITVP